MQIAPPYRGSEYISLVRRAVATGIVQNNNSNTNSKKRWNIITTVTVMKGVIPVELLVFDECTETYFSSQFVHHLVKENTLQLLIPAGSEYLAGLQSLGNDRQTHDVSTWNNDLPT